jgi:hypothetical protein
MAEEEAWTHLAGHWGISRFDKDGCIPIFQHKLGVTAGIFESEPMFDMLEAGDLWNTRNSISAIVDAPRLGNEPVEALHKGSIADTRAAKGVALYWPNSLARLDTAARASTDQVHGSGTWPRCNGSAFAATCAGMIPAAHRDRLPEALTALLRNLRLQEWLVHLRENGQQS